MARHEFPKTKLILLNPLYDYQTVKVLLSLTAMIAVRRAQTRLAPVYPTMAYEVTIGLLMGIIPPERTEPPAFVAVATPVAPSREADMVESVFIPDGTTPVEAGRPVAPDNMTPPAEAEIDVDPVALTEDSTDERELAALAMDEVSAATELAEFAS